jgi:hypothetical protein
MRLKLSWTGAPGPPATFVPHAEPRPDQADAFGVMAQNPLTIIGNAVTGSEAAIVDRPLSAEYSIVQRRQTETRRGRLAGTVALMTGGGLGTGRSAHRP